MKIDWAEQRCYVIALSHIMVIHVRYQDGHLHTQYSYTHTVTEEIPCCHKSLICNKYSMEVSYYHVNNGTE